MNRHLAPLLLLALANPAQSQTLRAIRVSADVPRPTDLQSAPGDDARLFVVEGRRGIRIIKDGVLLPAPFLDLSAELDGTWNQGIGSIAFHPDYAINGRFFVLYVDNAWDSHVAEYRVSSDPDVADPSSRIEILGPHHQKASVHLWNCLQFGPDGKLYVAIGDDTMSDERGSNPAQDLSSLLGKILRLDIDLPPPYIPPDNPFVGQTGVREEIWLWGLRQPWRFSFDPLTGDMFTCDVGSNDHEELDFVPDSSTGGENFGWPCLEGAVCQDHSDCLDCGDSVFVLPFHEYSHDEGRCAIIGGYAYRGESMPWLHGSYFFADYCTGRIWSLKYDGNAVTEYQERTADLAPWPGEGSIDLVTSFGVDAAGELYVLDNVGGEIFKIVEEDCGTSTYCTSTANSAGSRATIGSSGMTSLAAGDFVLTVAAAQPDKYGLFFYGARPDQSPFGDGFLCVRSPYYRLFPPVHLDALGAGSHLVDFQDPPQPEATILPGSTWHFQFWYRDPAHGGSGFNTSDGLRASFCP